MEELLRYSNPLNHTTDRFTTEPVELGGVTIPAGEWVLCVTSSANRDPSRFADPDRLDLRRDAAGHLAFGHGIHYCLGAPLARLEGEVAFRALLTRFPSLSLAVPESSLALAPQQPHPRPGVAAGPPGLTASAGGMPPASCCYQSDWIIVPSLASKMGPKSTRSLEADRDLAVIAVKRAVAST